MQISIKTSLALALFGLLATRPAGAQTIVNGDFENVQIGSPFFSTNSADIPGWTHMGDVGDALLWGVGYADSGGNITTAGHGNQFVTMGGGNATGTGSWQQTITGLTASDSYTVNFMMASETGAFGQSITVDFPTGSSTAAMTFAADPSSANYWRTWESKSMTFVATDSSATLRFTATTSEDVGLDNVSVTPAAVPEASTTVSFGLLLVLGGVVIAAKRRKIGA